MDAVLRAQLPVELADFIALLVHTFNMAPVLDQIALRGARVFIIRNTPRYYRGVV